MTSIKGLDDPALAYVDIIDLSHDPRDDLEVDAGLGHDWVYGSKQNDTINGDRGNDHLYGNGGNDTINGGPGNDEIHGYNPFGEFAGAEAGDTLIGGSGNDVIHGDDGDDRIYGDNLPHEFQAIGNDTLVGGRGRDTMTGGEGADTFVFRSEDMITVVDPFFRRAVETYETDTITDFGTNSFPKSGRRDQLDVSSLLDKETMFTGTTAQQAIDRGFIYFVQHGTWGQAGFGTTVFIDRDGGSHSARGQLMGTEFAIVELQGTIQSSLSAADLIV